MAASTMHAPLRYASDKLLRRRKGGAGLTEFLEGHLELGSSAQVVAVDLADATRGVIIVDRRTVARWLAAVEGDSV